MMGNDFRGDFTGFEFDGVHSSELGLIRVSSGDRYNENLTPEIKDITAEVPGMHGEYYFGSTYGKRTFDIEFAFDSLTEEQFRRLRKIFGTREIKKLIFDERPYKYYMVKLESPIELSYVCFDEPKRHVVGIEDNDKRYGVRKVEKVVSETVIDEETEEETVIETTIRVPERIYPYEILEGTQRVYKGEGKMTLVSYFPFARSVYKWLPADEEDSDWAISSGILSEENYVGEFDIYDNTSGIINIYNGGDLPTGFRLYCPFSASNSMKIQYYADSESSPILLNIDTITPLNNSSNTNDIGFLVNTSNGLIQGVQTITDNGSSIITSGNIYNKYIASGYLFELQPNILSDNARLIITDINDDLITASDIKIFYDYLYF